MTINELKGEAGRWKISRQRLIDLAIGIGSLILLEFIARPYYRPFIYANKIYDFHVADTLGNSLGTVAAIFIIAGLLGKDRIRNRFLINTTIISMVIYELAQPVLGKPIDSWDILATILAGGVCILAYRIIHRSKITKQAP